MLTEEIEITKIAEPHAKHRMDGIRFWDTLKHSTTAA